MARAMAVLCALIGTARRSPPSKLVNRQPLVDSSGGLHRAAANALLGSQVPLVP